MQVPTKNYLKVYFSIYCIKLIQESADPNDISLVTNRDTPNVHIQMRFDSRYFMFHGKSNMIFISE